MAFDGLTERLQGVFKKLRGKGKLTEQEVNDALRINGFPLFNPEKFRKSLFDKYENDI